MLTLNRNMMLAGLLALIGTLGGCTYSDGSRAGTVSKFSHKGFVCKSWEGELVMGGVRSQTNQNGTDTAVPNVFQFSVTDKAIIPLVQAKLESGDRAVLHYNQEVLPPFCWRRTSYVIKGVN